MREGLSVMSSVLAGSEMNDSVFCQVGRGKMGVPYAPSAPQFLCYVKLYF
jgi:hypothetical protein